MRRWLAIVVLINALGGAVGCRLFEKAAPKDRAAEPASRGRDWMRDRQDRGPPDNWLDNSTPSAGRGARVPAADTVADPRKAANRMLAGIVEDEYGKPIAGAYITVENADPIKAGYGAPMGVESNREGYFEINGLVANEHYMLACTVNNADNKKLGGRLAVQVPNSKIRLKLREDYAPPPSRTPSDLPPTIPAPRPTESPAATPKPDDWSPVPSTPAPPSRGDLVAPGPTPDWKPPPAVIPGPAPSIPPPSSSRAIPRDARLMVLDDFGKPKNLLSGRPEDLILLDFISSTCAPCKRAIPSIVAFHEKHGKQIEVVAVLCDHARDDVRVDLANRYRAEHKLPYAVFADGTNSAADTLKVEYFPTLILLDGTGRRIWKGQPRNLAEIEAILRTR